MNKLLAALIAAALASVAAAQTPPVPTSKERQQDVQTTTEASANANTGATTAKQQAANVQKSKQVSKLSKEEQAKLATDASKSLNPENSSGAAATAAMRKQKQAQSKATPKQNTDSRRRKASRARRRNWRKFDHNRVARDRPHSNKGRSALEKLVALSVGLRPFAPPLATLRPRNLGYRPQRQRPRIARSAPSASRVPQADSVIFDGALPALTIRPSPISRRAPAGEAAGGWFAIGTGLRLAKGGEETEWPSRFA